MNEVTRAAKWLYSRLAADGVLAAAAPGGIHEHPAPPGTASPLITYQLQAPVDVKVVPDKRVWAEMVYLVRAIGQGRSYVVLEAAADRLDVLLDRADGATSDARVISCTRDSAYALSEERNGVEYRHLGGLFRLLVQPSST